MSKQDDDRQLDLLSWEPPIIVARLDEQRIRAASPRARIARAVAATLRESPLSREEIAQRMAAYLGEPVSKSSLDAYASEAREDHTISALRLAALARACNDPRALQELAEPLQQAVVPAHYVPAIRAEMFAAKSRELAAEAARERRRMNPSWRQRGAA